MPAPQSDRLYFTPVISSHEALGEHMQENRACKRCGRVAVGCLSQAETGSEASHARRRRRKKRTEKDGPVQDELEERKCGAEVHQTWEEGKECLSRGRRVVQVERAKATAEWAHR